MFYSRRPQPITPEEQRKATLEHEMDHVNTFKAFFEIVNNKVSGYQGRKYSSSGKCGGVASKLSRAVVQFYFDATRHSNIFDSPYDERGRVDNDRTAGDAYKFFPLKDTLDLSNVEQ